MNSVSPTSRTGLSTRIGGPPCLPPMEGEPGFQGVSTGERAQSIQGFEVR